MFTGIITNLGKLVKKENSLFVFQTDKSFCKNIDSGTSVAVNGVCLTVVKKTQNSFSVEIMPETAAKTMLETLNIQDIVNLELPATPDTFLSGHIVQGHIDLVSRLSKVTGKGNSRILKFIVPARVSGYIVEKGSIAVNGVSLTVIEAKNTYFTVGIIPYTWNKTMLCTIKTGDFVNVELDILAKYAGQLLKHKTQ